MTTKPLVSIIVLTYNQEKTIGRTLDSILVQQTIYPFEIIIGEDASPNDNTRAVCREYVERYPEKVRLIPEAANKGILRNFRDCIQACRGQYVCQCAGDDWWHNPDKIQVQIDYLETHPECGMVHSDVDVFYPATQRTEHSINKYHGKAIHSGFFAPYLLTTILPIYTPTPAYRKSLVDKVNFDEYVQNGFMMEDLPMWLEMSHFADFYYIDQSLATYTSADGSFCRPDSVEKHIQFEKNVTRVQLYYREKYYSELVSQQQIIECENRRLMSVYLRFGRYRSAFECFVNEDLTASMLRRVSQKNYLLFRLGLLMSRTVRAVSNIKSQKN